MVKAVVFGWLAAIVGAYKGLNAGGGPERRRPGGQRGGDRRVHAAVLPQRDHHRHLLPGRPTAGALSDGQHQRGRTARSPSGRGAAPSLEQYGDQLLFYVKALAWAPRAIRRYPREITNTLAEVTFGAGGLTLIAGTVGVIAFLAFFAGTEVGIQGYASLSQIGVAKFSAFISAYFNTREVAPLVSAIALAATVGCGYTARLGAMRISEEIDALEVMGIPSLPFLVTTRMIAAFIAVIPLYIVALCASYLSPRLIVDAHLRPVAGHLRPLLPAVPAADRHALVVRQAAVPRRSRSS